MKKNDKENTLIIYGCGGHARSVADVALHNGIKKLIFIDQQANENEKLFGFDVMRTLPEHNDYRCIVAVGDAQKRAILFNDLVIKNKDIVTLRSSSAYFGKYAKLDAGVFVGHTAHIGPAVKVGIATLLNTHCIIEHDCDIGKYCHISVNAVIAGKCQFGDFVMIGAGATVIDNIQICSNVTIGAGAVVVDHIKEPGTYVGIPARPISQNENGVRLV